MHQHFGSRVSGVNRIGGLIADASWPEVDPALLVEDEVTIAVQVKGKPAPYDKEIAVKVLTSTDERGMGQTFRDMVAYAAGIVADNHLGMAEDIAGN